MAVVRARGAGRSAMSAIQLISCHGLGSGPPHLSINLLPRKMEDEPRPRGGAIELPACTPSPSDGWPAPGVLGPSPDLLDRDPDCPRLLGEGAGDGLADPPGGGGGELEASVIVELLDRSDQAKVALLDQVQEAQATADVLLADRDHQPQVGLSEPLPRFVGTVEAVGQILLGPTESVQALEVGRAHGFDIPGDGAFDLGPDLTVLEVAMHRRRSACLPISL